MRKGGHRSDTKNINKKFQIIPFLEILLTFQDVDCLLCRMAHNFLCVLPYQLTSFEYFIESVEGFVALNENHHRVLRVNEKDTSLFVGQS